MNDQDQLIRFSFEELDIRGELVYLDESWQQVLARHDYPANVRLQLGSALAAVALLSLTIKFDGTLILQIQGDGPLHSLVTQASSDGSLRGLARWQGNVPNGRLKEVFGASRMLLTMIPKEGERYQSIVEMNGSTLADALKCYFDQSEQLPSSFQFHASDKRVTGLFLQALPATPDTGIRNTREEDWCRLNLLAETVESEEALSIASTTLLHRLFHEETIRLYPPKPVFFSCSCSREKVERTLIALGAEELHAIIRDEGSIKVDCEFCNTKYRFDTAAVDRLYSEQLLAPADAVLH